MATSMISAGAVYAATSGPPPLTGADTSFQGLANVVVGNAQIVQTPTIDTITVSTAKTVINFTPFDTANGGGPITFLPSGRTGLFQNDPNSGVTNFTVLNRVIPTDATRAIRFDGTVQSRIANATGGSSPGGTILFYSPGGIIASSSAAFDVGSLVLSAADIDPSFSSNSFSFSGAAPGTAVDINSGASILAQGAGSYVALVAPRVIQSGSVRSDGSVGYIAAEAVDVTIQNNLFDISFVQGTDGGAAVTHTGSTELTRAPDDTTPQRIYVAAVPKNEAITTLISGSLGYSAATAASVQNGAVILSAGRNVSETGYGGTTFTDFAGGTAPASITIGADASTMFSTSVLTNATGDALIAPSAGTTIQFNNSVVLNADRLAEVRTVANSNAIFDADLTVSSNNLLADAAARVIALGETGYGGTGYGPMPGTINVGGSLFINGGPSFQNEIVRTARAELIADGGQISVESGTEVIAADNALENGTLNGFGGNALVRVGVAGSQLSTGDLFVSARAVADNAGLDVPGNAKGGSAKIELTGGNFTSGHVELNSDALGLAGGTVTAGSVALVANGGTASLGDISLSSRASITEIDQPTPTAQTIVSQDPDANVGAAQALTGGNIQLDVINTTLNINGDLTLSAEAIGSQGLGSLQGGTIGITVDNGSLLVENAIVANASAEESGSVTGIAPAPVKGGTITGLVSNNGNILAASMNYDANAASGGDAFGGMVSLTTNSGGSIQSNDILALGAAATVRDVESAGDAVGGNILVNINSGALNTGTLLLDASAVGGDAVLGGVGGSAMGGTARVNVTGGNSTIGAFSLTSDARGGRGGNGDGNIQAGGAGGTGTAGISEININAGVVHTAGFLLTSSATGGDGGDGISTGGAGGAAIGGRATTVTSEAATLFLMKAPGDPEPAPLASSIDSSARGGAGGFGQSMQGGNGGIANGGVSVLTLAGANIAPNTMPFAVDISVNSEAVGGIGGTSNSTNGGAGGSAMGGAATLNFINNQIDFGSVSLSTRGSGGSGGNGANFGYGMGTLPNGGIGGDGSGGAASVNIVAPLTNVAATNIANLAIAAEAVGGSGGVGGNGGNGGNAINAGSASFTHTAGAVTIPVAILTANSFGGRGGLGLGGNGGVGGNSGGGTARLTTSNAMSNLAVNVAGVSAVARGGFGGDAQANPNTTGGNAGNATGGTAEILAQNGATVSLNLTASTDASAFGGRGGIGLAGAGSGGNATGGISRIDGTDGKLGASAALLDVISTGTGGNGGQAGYGGIPPVTATGGSGGTGTGGTAILAKAGFASTDISANINSDGNGGVGGNGPSGGKGGAGSGGTSSFVSNGFTSILVSSQGRGGAGGNGTSAFDSVGGNGGNGSGGTAQISVNSGILNAGSVAAIANAAGGNGGFGYTAGNGGNALGGNANFSALGGATANFVALNLSAAANGGSGGLGADGAFEAMSMALANGGTGGSGGNAAGGSVLLTSGGASTSLVVGDLAVSSVGFAGEGGNGGNGGTTVDNLAGAGGNGGAGGAGNGGINNLRINGGSAQFNNGPMAGPALINSGGFGAAGGRGGEGGQTEGQTGVAGFNAANGSASGGSSSLTVSSAQLSATHIRFDSDGRGPGTVNGGNATFSLTNGATYVGNSLTMTANGVVEDNRRRDAVDNISPSNSVGSGSTSSMANAVAGTVSVSVDKATALLTGSLEVGANAEARLGTAQGGSVNIIATGGTLTTPSTLVTANGSSFVSGTEIGGGGGMITIRAENAVNGATGVLNLGATDLQASGFSTPVDGEAMTNAAAGRISIAANDGQTTAINMSALTAQTLGRNTAFNPGNGIFLGADRGAIIANGAVTLLSDESISVAALGTGNLFVGNDLSAEALNTINITHNGRAANANTILAAKADFIAGNAFNAMSGSRVRADTDLNITSQLSSVSADSLVAGDDLLVTARNGNVSIMSATTLGLGMDRSDIIIDSGAQVTLGAADADASLAVRGASIAGTNLTAGEDIALSASGNISVTTALAGDDFSAVSSGGNIALNGITTNASGADDRAVNFGYGEIGFAATAANGSNISATAGYGNIDLGTLNAANDLTVNAMSIGNLAPATLAAGQDIMLTGQTSVSIGDATAGRDFSISSNGSASVVNVSAGDDLTINAAGAVSATGLLLTSGLGSLGGESNIEIITPGAFTFNAIDAFSNFGFNGSSISGNSIIAGNMIGITADTASSNALTTGTSNITIDARSVSVGIANSGLDFIVDTQSAANSNILLDTVTAARDIRLTGGSNGITATSLNAGDDIDVNGTGTVSITNALTNGSFNSGYGSDPSNISITAATSAMLGAIRARDTLNVTTMSGTTANMLTADRGAVFVNGGTSANIMNAAATFGSVTINADAVDAANVNAATDVIVNFGASAMLGTVVAGNSIAAAGAGAISAMNLTAGEDIALRAGGGISLLSGMAGDDIDVTAGGVISLGSMTTTGTGPDNRRAILDMGPVAFGAETFARSNILANSATGITVTSANARDTLGLRTDGNVTAGTLVAGEDATFATSGTTTITSVMAGDDIDITAAAGATVRSAITSGKGSDDRRVFLPGGSAFFTGENLTRSNIIALSGGAVTLGNAAGTAIPEISAAATLAVKAGGTITASNIAAGEDIAFSSPANITVDAVTAGDDLIFGSGSNISLNTGTTTGLGADDRKVDLTGPTIVIGGQENSVGSNIALTANTGSVFVTTGQAKDNLTITASNGATATSLAADRGAVLVNGGSSADIMNATASLGSVTINADVVDVDMVNAGSDANINFITSAMLGTVAAGNDFNLIGTGNAVVGAATASRDIVAMVGGDVTIGSANAGRSLRSTSTNLNATTLNAGTDVVILTDASADLGTTTAGARIVANAGSSIDFTQLMSGTTTSLVAGTSITGGNANAGTTLSLNANGGAAGFGMLSSVGNTIITASGAIMGGSANAGGALTLNSGSNGVTASSLTSGTGNNLTVTASNGGNATIGTATSGLDLSVNATNISVTSGSAVRDVLYTAANSIIAGTTSAGRKVALNAVGTINATTTTAVTDILANSTGDVTLLNAMADNIFAVSTGDVTLGIANAGTMLGVNAQNISGTSLMAGEDIRLIASRTANVGTATAGDDFDVSATNGITLGSITAMGTARDDRSLAFNAPAFAIVASPADGSDIRLSSNGTVSASNLDAGDDIRVDSGNFILTGLAKTRGLGNTGGSSDILINAGATVIASVEATDNLTVNATTFNGTTLSVGGMINVMTSGNQLLGTANATRGPINGTSTLGTISFAGLVTSGDIDLTAANGISGGSAQSGSEIRLSGGNGGVDFDMLQSSGSTSINSGASVTGDMIRAGNAIIIGGDTVNIGTAITNRDSLFVNGRDITIGTAESGFDIIIDTGKSTDSRIELGSATASRDIILSGASNGLTATSLLAGDDIEVDITGKANISTARTTGSFNSGYGDHGYGDYGYGDTLPDEGGNGPSDITLNAAQAMIGTAQAADNVSLTTVMGTMANSVIADRGAVFVNGGTSANIMNATATLGSVTINADAISANNVNAATDVAVNFGASATLGTVVAGNSINASGTGDLNFTDLTSGTTTTLMAGGNITGGTATAGALLSVMADSIDVDSLTSSRSNVIASARSVDIGSTTAAIDTLIDTKGLTNSSVTLGTVNAGRDISISGGTNGITATTLTAGDDVDVVGAGNVMLASASATGSFNSGYGSTADTNNITVTATMGNAVISAGAQAKDNITVTTRDGTTANSLTADRGNIVVNGGTLANINRSTATLGSVTLNAATIAADTVTAGTDAIVNAGVMATGNNITAGRDIAISGASTGIDVTTIRAGDDIDINVTGNARLSTAMAADTITITGTPASSISASFVLADRGDISIIGANSVVLGAVNSALGKVDVIANSVNTLAIDAGTNVTVVYDSLASLGTVNARQAVDISGTGSSTFANLSSGTTTRANVGAALSGGSISAGTSLNVTSVGAFTTTGPITAGTSATIIGGSITAANATAGTTLSLSANAGAIQTADLSGGTGVQLRGSGIATTGNITASANNVDAVLTGGLTSGNVTAANNIIIGNTTNSVTAGALTAGNSIAVNNGGAVMLGSATGTGITLASNTSSINAGTVTARGALTAAAATELTLGTATSSANIALTGQTINATMLTAATNIAATSSGAMTLGTARATGGNLSLTAAGALSAMNAGALGDVRLTTTNGGNVTTGTLSSGSAFMGGTTGGMPGAGDIVIASDGSATMNGNSSAGRNLNVTARNLISVGGVANGTAIDLKSTDIAINTTTGRIGEQGRTTVAQLTNTGTGVTTIGGAGVTTGFSLSNAEAQRIFAGDIIITAARTATPPAGTQGAQTLNAAAPDVVVDALTLTGASGQTGATAGNIGATGSLRIETPGKLRTVGAVAISNMATANRLQLNAAQSIEVDAATGSVSLTGAAGALGGTIELTAPSVIAASLTAIGEVAAAVDGRAINDRLAINDNAINDAGAFSANGIIVNVTNGFFVQNSGIKELSAFSFGDRRGITVGTGGLTINAASPATRIFVSGRQLQANGTFITGVPFLRGQSINGTQIQLSTFPPTPFDSASTVNGCAIINSAACLINIDGGSLARDVVGQSDDDGGGSSEGNGSSGGGNDFVRFEFKSLDSSTFAPVIDDPVTGVGNDDLYALYDARDCTDDQNLESCGTGEAKPQ